MSTATITSAAAYAAPSPKVALLRSFWLKTKATAAPLFATATDFLSAVLGKIPFPAAALAVPVAMTTRFGYGLLGRTVGFLARTAGRLVAAAATLVHRSIDFAGDRLVDVISVFSESGATKVGNALATFGMYRLYGAGLVRTIVAGTAEEIAGYFNHRLTRSAVAVTSAAVAGTIAFGWAAPSAFTSLLTSLPIAQAATVAGIAAGGWAALAPIATVGLAAMLWLSLRSLFGKGADKVAEVAVETVMASADAAVAPEMIQATELVDAALAESEREHTAGINVPSATKKGKRH